MAVTYENDPPGFAAALVMHMRRRGETEIALSKGISTPDFVVSTEKIRQWCSGMHTPQTPESMDALRRIERRYHLPKHYFLTRLPHRARAVTGHALKGFSDRIRAKLSWHMPDDFNDRTPEEQAEILTWANRNVLGTESDYRQYLKTVVQTPYSLRFASDMAKVNRRGESNLPPIETGRPRGERAKSTIPAPANLEGEVANLVDFHTRHLAEVGKYRKTIWNTQTAAHKIEIIGLMFGAMAAPKRTSVDGLGIGLEKLTLALLLFPAVWDWFLEWKRARRGFYTVTEMAQLILGASMAREDTGWLRQFPEVASALQPVDGLVSQNDIDEAKADWGGACDRLYKHIRARIRELSRLVKRHHDTFEAVAAVLNEASPLTHYRKIPQEIVRLMPDETVYPRPAAEAVRAFLIIRFALHLGLRQKNLRQLLLSRKGQPWTSERRLDELKCGELRWKGATNRWEVFIPASAFKNSYAPRFDDGQPFLLELPDLDRLYEFIDAYVDRHRPRLLAGIHDTPAFFVKTVKRTSATPVYEDTTFYLAWRHMIERYGIFNPWTGRGAIAGLLPHGPHNARDVLATHVLKKTGSYELAGYAIQSTAETVRKHYARFLPHDKAVMAARVLDEAWRD